VVELRELLSRLLKEALNKFSTVPDKTNQIKPNPNNYTDI